MLVIPVKGPSFQNALYQIQKAETLASLIELRVDFLEELSLSQLKTLLTCSHKPFIITLRPVRQGGAYSKSENCRLEEILKIAELKPAFFDLEHDIDPAFIRDFIKKYRDTRLILSYHNFKETPKDLDTVLSSMQNTAAADYYKIALFANDATDALSLLAWAKTKQANVIPVTMGKDGQFGRILAKIVGAPFTYASLEPGLLTAPYQVDAKTLLERYRYLELSEKTALYGLIGYPIEPSMSDVTHNAFFQKKGVDAVYVKIPVKEESLSSFLSYAQQLGFKGLSVTMPLKEAVIPFLDAMEQKAKKIGAVNTISHENGKLIGYNTDSLGALNALEKRGSVRGKTILLIGAGGAAKAIAFEAILRGAKVLILNRSYEKACKLALEVGGLALSKELTEEIKYDIIINATPADIPIEEKWLLPGTLAMDIRTRPHKTPFLQAIEKKGSIIYGYEMFFEQAKWQFTLWGL